MRYWTVFLKSTYYEETEGPGVQHQYDTRMLSHLLAKHGRARNAFNAYGPMNVGNYYAEKALGINNNYRRQ
ncbi:hypothetical protein ACFLV7_13730 [Chloroflexota bacterium]